MKKFAIIIAGVLLSLSAIPANAQSLNAGFYDGSWNILLKGTPNGDVKMVFKFTKMNDSLAGVVLDSTGTQISEMSKLEAADKDGITVYFSAQGYDLSITFAKKDDDHIAGSLMNMFDVDGERVKK